MSWLERQLGRLRSLDPLVIDGVLAVVLAVVGIFSAFGQDIHEADGALRDGFSEPSGWLVATALLTCAPIAFRRRAPLAALAVSSLGILVHLLVGWPEGALPVAPLVLTYSVGAWCPLRRAIAGLVLAAATIVALAVSGSPGLDAVGALGTIAQFAAVWAVGVALRNRRAASDARVREAEGRAEAERQRTGRALAEERLRIAQELHDVVAHSMSVIAVQAGAGAHVLDDRPDQARAALEAISVTARGTLSEMRRLLGVLRDSDGARSSAPAPTLADLPSLVDEVRAAGVPATLVVEGAPECAHAGVELSAFRVVQEALTNVIKHAGKITRVGVTVRYLPGSIAVEVVDDGRGLAAQASPGGPGAGSADGSGHGLLGMRERVELWGGELNVGPVSGGGYRVEALLPYGGSE